MAYQHFAEVYDRLMDHAPYEQWVSFTNEVIKRRGNDIKKVVDLGCGTGEIAIRMDRLGYDVTGVDLSTEMLSLATSKSNEQKGNVRWIKQDIRSLEGFHDVELFISYCDVINYLTDKVDVLHAFEAVYNGLTNDGVFIFDVHHIDYAKQYLMDQTFTNVEEDIAYIWDCQPGDNHGEMFHHITCFYPSNNAYARFDEMHHQQVYEIEEYVQLLKKVGFAKIEIYHDFKLENSISPKNVERNFIVAQKNT